jgi:hypothetical protein
MPLTLKQRLHFALAGIPSRTIAKALRVAEEARLDVTAQQLASHIHAGGRPLDIVNAMVSLKDNGLTSDFIQCCAADLITKDLPKCITAVRIRRSYEFGANTGDSADSLVLRAEDGTTVAAMVRLTYHPRVIEAAIGDTKGNLQERVFSALTQLCAGTSSATEIRARREEHEAALTRQMSKNKDLVHLELTYA